MTRIFHHLLLVAVLLAAITPRAALARASVTVRPATLTLSEGARSVSLIDGPMEFQTSVGSIGLAASEFLALRTDSTSGVQVVTSRRGDRWVLSPQRRHPLLPLLDPATGRPLKLEPANLLALETAPAAPAVLYPAPHASVELDDGTRLLIETRDWVIDLAYDRQLHRLPAGAIQTLTRDALANSGALVPSKPFWTVVFAGGATLGGITHGERTWSALDTHGNGISFNPERLLRLRGRQQLPLPVATLPPNTPPSLHSRELRTVLGKLMIPETLIASSIPLGTGQRLQTLAGDQITAGLASSRRAPAPGLATAAAPPVPSLPAGWMRFSLIGGDHVIARFAETGLLWRVSGEAQAVSVSTPALRAVHRDGQAWILESHEGRLWHGTPPEASTTIRLLLNGMQHTLPWEALLRAGTTNTPAMVRVDGGLFLMGRTRGEGMPDELPPHALTVAPFLLDRHEVTRAQFAAFAEATRYRTDAEQAGLGTTWRAPGFPQEPDAPAVWLTWHDAIRYCNWRSTLEQLTPCYVIDKHNAITTVLPLPNGYRLPTEAEWEFAARAGGQDRLYPWGDAATAADFASHANYRAPPGTDSDPWLWTNPVLAFPPDEQGLYGMAGNVWEWCEDWYFDQAYGSIHRQRLQDPCVRTGDVAGLTRRVMRGGSFDNAAELLRCVSRGHGLPGASANRVGFRCARTLDLSLSAP